MHQDQLTSRDLGRPGTTGSGAELALAPPAAVPGLPWYHRPSMIQGMVAGGGGGLGPEVDLELKMVQARAKAAMPSDDEISGPDHGHYPYARQVRTGWYHDAGRWAYEGVDDHLVGDVLPAVRRHRRSRGESGTSGSPASGPYGHKHSAERAANKHFKAFRGA